MELFALRENSINLLWLISIFIITFTIPAFANEGPKIDVIPQTWDFGKVTADKRPEHIFEDEYGAWENTGYPIEKTD